MFVNQLIKNAKKHLNCKEDPPGSNRSLCVDNFSKAIHGAAHAWAWCATFLSYVFDETFKDFGLQNTFIKTAKTSDMLNWGKQKKLVDAKPAVGSVMYVDRYDNKGKKVGGHVGLVIKVEGNNFYTIDGNSDDSVQTRARKIEKKYSFIHTEKQFDVGNLALKNPQYTIPIILAAAGIGTAYYLLRD